MTKPLTVECPECLRIFDMTNPVDADEWAHGHDCDINDQRERWYEEQEHRALNGLPPLKRERPEP